RCQDLEAFDTLSSRTLRLHLLKKRFRYAGPNLCQGSGTETFWIHEQGKDAQAHVPVHPSPPGKKEQGLSIAQRAIRVGTALSLALRAMGTLGRC
ncbi:hypothetical protein NFI96_004042, partial [Prochilodus magdalenae]